MSGVRQKKRKMVCSPSYLDSLERDELLTGCNDVYNLTKPGQLRVKRLRTSIPLDDPYQSQHRNNVAGTVRMDGADHAVIKNLNESPLGRLRARKTPDGSPWLSVAEVEAGERLRRDFTKAQLMQSVSSNWNSGVGASGKSSGMGRKADLSDTALDARDRLNQALAFVGPEIGHVLTDVCCHLKGLETVESERRWPPRSAKLLLRAGLGLLARFYGTTAGKKDRPTPATEASTELHAR